MVTVSMEGGNLEMTRLRVSLYVSAARAEQSALLHAVSRSARCSKQTTLLRSIAKGALLRF